MMDKSVLNDKKYEQNIAGFEEKQYICNRLYIIGAFFLNDN